MRFDPVQAKGLFFIADPHLADTPPGQRLPGYREQVLDKLAACLDEARRRDMAPVILGDLFHWPRDNSNLLLVRLMELFEADRPYVLVGNHDKYQARLTDDVSLAVLHTAGVVRLMDEPGPQFLLHTPTGDALIGASPDGAPIPRGFDRDPSTPGTVVWLTHHNLQFPEFLDRAHKLKELPGIDLVVNGHIHRPQPTVVKGMTTWSNPGNLVRLTFTRRSMEREPKAHAWAPGMAEPEGWVVPHLDFREVFPDQAFPPEIQEDEGASNFLTGLERLAWRRTQEGVGLREFLQANLNPEQPESKLIWQLYEEVIRERG